jgi:vacuolar-type H+-ATPase subunit F/Vma7
MSRWIVPLEAYAEIEVEADTKEEAVKKAEEEINTSDFDIVKVTDDTIQNLDDGIYYVLTQKE